MPSSKIKFRGPFNQFLYIRNISYYRMTFCTLCNFGFPVFCFLKTSDFKTFQHFELNYWSIQSLAFVIDWLIVAAFHAVSKYIRVTIAVEGLQKLATKTSKSFLKGFNEVITTIVLCLCQLNGCNIICGVTRTLLHLYNKISTTKNK